MLGSAARGALGRQATARAIATPTEPQTQSTKMRNRLFMVFLTS
jgi:hypothetical protein